jgi:hypothetical protein
LHTNLNAVILQWVKVFSVFKHFFFQWRNSP